MMSRIAKNCFVLSSQSFRGPAGRRRWNSRSAVYSAPGQFIRGRISGVPFRLRKFCFSAALCGEGRQSVCVLSRQAARISRDTDCSAFQSRLCSALRVRDKFPGSPEAPSVRRRWTQAEVRNRRPEDPCVRRRRGTACLR